MVKRNFRSILGNLNKSIKSVKSRKQVTIKYAALFWRKNLIYLNSWCSKFSVTIFCVWIPRYTVCFMVFLLDQVEAVFRKPFFSNMFLFFWNRTSIFKLTNADFCDCIKNIKITLRIKNATLYPYYCSKIH